jgi:hypothetical protein
VSRVLGLFVSRYVAVGADQATIAWARKIVSAYAAAIGSDGTLITDDETLRGDFYAPGANQSPFDGLAWANGMVWPRKFVGFCPGGAIKVGGKTHAFTWAGRCRDSALVDALVTSRRNGHDVGALVLTAPPDRRGDHPDDTAAASILLQARQIYADDFELGDTTPDDIVKHQAWQMFAKETP